MSLVSNNQFSVFPTEIFNHIIDDLCSNQFPSDGSKTIEPLENSEHNLLFQEAEKAAQTANNLFNLAITDKYFFQLLNDNVVNKSIKTITQCIEIISKEEKEQSKKGDTIPNWVECGRGLLVLRIYLCYKREILKIPKIEKFIWIDDSARLWYTTGGIFPSALKANYQSNSFSPSFIAFILKLDKSSNLDLLKQEDHLDHLPFHTLCGNETVPFSIKKQLLENLLAHDQNANDPFASPNADPIFLALTTPECTDDELIAFMKNCGANIDYQNQKGNTILHWAAKYEFRKVVDRALQITQAVLIQGANPNIENEDGETPLHVCLENFWYHRDSMEGYWKIAELLVESGAKFTFPLLKFAEESRYIIQKENDDECSILVSEFYKKFFITHRSKIDWTLIDSQGNTYLHMLLNDHSEQNNASILNGIKNYCIWMLETNEIAFKFQIMAKNNEGKTPYELIPRNWNLHNFEGSDWKNELAILLIECKNALHIELTQDETALLNNQFIYEEILPKQFQKNKQNPSLAENAKVENFIDQPVIKHEPPQKEQKPSLAENAKVAKIIEQPVIKHEPQQQMPTQTSFFQSTIDKIMSTFSNFCKNVSYFFSFQWLFPNIK